MPIMTRMAITSEIRNVSRRGDDRRRFMAVPLFVVLEA
jgi:hypothetical protein